MGVSASSRRRPGSSGKFGTKGAIGLASYVYILASRMAGTLYIGVTSNIIKRIHEHKTGIIRGFTSRYKVKRLVYYEVYEDITQAIKREKQMKEWKREWKIKLIEKDNPKWDDLFAEITR